MQLFSHAEEAKNAIISNTEMAISQLMIIKSITESSFLFFFVHFLFRQI